MIKPEIRKDTIKHVEENFKNGVDPIPKFKVNLNKSLDMVAHLAPKEVTARLQNNNFLEDPKSTMNTTEFNQANSSINVDKRMKPTYTPAPQGSERTVTAYENPMDSIQEDDFHKAVGGRPTLKEIKA